MTFLVQAFINKKHSSLRQIKIKVLLRIWPPKEVANIKHPVSICLPSSVFFNHIEMYIYLQYLNFQCCSQKFHSIFYHQSCPKITFLNCTCSMCNPILIKTFSFLFHQVPPTVSSILPSVQATDLQNRGFSSELSPQSSSPSQR